jgi:TM2 domain-containing membrane protein YozV
MKKCRKCEATLNDNSLFCNFCGAEQANYQNPRQNYQQQGYRQNPPPYQQINPEQKSKLIASLLGIFLGIWGVHWFYLGYKKKAWLNLGLFLTGFALGCAFLAFIFLGLFFGKIFIVLGSVCMSFAPLPLLASTIIGFVQGIEIISGSIKCDAKGIPLQDS